MITITIDFVGLAIGFIVGLFCGAMISLWTEMREGGPWSSGYTTGYMSGADFRKRIEQSVESEMKKKHDT